MSDTPAVPVVVDVPKLMRGIDYGWKLALIAGSVLSLLFTVFGFYRDQTALVKQVADLKTEVQEMRTDANKNNREIIDKIAGVDGSTAALKQELQFYMQTQKGK